MRLLLTGRRAGGAPSLCSPGSPGAQGTGLGSVGQRKPHPAKRQILRRGLGSPSPLPSPGPLGHQCIQARPPTALPQILRKLLPPCLTPEICVLTGVSWVIPFEPLEGHVPCHPAPLTPTPSCSPAHVPREASPHGHWHSAQADLLIRAHLMLPSPPPRPAPAPGRPYGPAGNQGPMPPLVQSVQSASSRRAEATPCLPVSHWQRWCWAGRAVISADLHILARSPPTTSCPEVRGPH